MNFESVVVRIIIYFASFLAVLVSLPCHEFAHAFVAVKNGDMTPKYSGRYTLNPFAHFDMLGLLMMILVRFGWAKPVPVNPNNFRNYKLGCVTVSIAGVTVNLILAIIFCPLMMLAYKYLSFSGTSRYLQLVLYYFLSSMFYLNLGLMVFNLLPLYPLDGFRLYDALAKRRGKFYFWLMRYSFYILIGILLLGVAADYTGIAWLDIIGFIRDYIAGWIIKFWGLFIV